MKTVIISTAAALLAVVAQAAPAPAPAQNEARQFQVSITFHGAGGASYSQQFPADNSVHTICTFPFIPSSALGHAFLCYAQGSNDITANPLAVSSISSVGGGFCTFSGAQGSSTVVFGEQTVPVGPPQTQIRGSCDNA